MGENLSRCASCKQIYYCGKSCQKKDWKNGHSIECKSELYKDPILLADGKIVDVDLNFKVLRSLAFLHLHEDKARSPHNIYDGSSKSFYDLMAHEDQLEKSGQFDGFCVKVVDRMKEDEGGFKGIKQELQNVTFLRKLMGIWATNSFQIQDDSFIQTPVIGVGIYIQTSFFDHSCRPTAVRVTGFPSCAMEVG